VPRTVAELPAPEALREVLHTLLAQGQTDEAVEVACRLLERMHEHAHGLELRLAQMLRQAYGRRSEKIDPNQLALLLEALAHTPEPGGKEEDVIAQAARERAAQRARERERTRPKPPGRKPLPADLPREEIVHRPPEHALDCPHCRAPRVRIGAERSEVLDWIPASFRVLVHVREKYACPNCREGVAIAPVPDRVIDSGRPSAGLLAHVLVSKFRDHLPLNRQVAIFARAGVDLPTSTLCDWVREGAELLDPIAQAIHERALGAHALQIDDTGLRVLDRDHPDGVRRGHLWALVGDRCWVSFRYTPTWEGKAARALVEDRVGWLQADGYAGFDQLFKRPGATAIEVACMAHVRRRFVEALEGGDLRAAIAVEKIRKLYRVERAAREAGLDPPATLALRRQESRPVIDGLGSWIAEVYDTIPPKSPLGKALYYTLGRWSALVRFLEDGALDIDNNGVERALRAACIGRKNWMFAGSDDGAQRAAILYTVISTAVLFDVEPWAYVRDLLEKISSGFPQRRIDELLPEAWRTLHPQARLRRHPAAAPAA
jgi:transposase